MKVTTMLLWLASAALFFTTVDTVFVHARSFFSYLVINVMEWTLAAGSFQLGRWSKLIDEVLIERRVIKRVRNEMIAQ